MHILELESSILTNAEVQASLLDRRSKRNSLAKPLLPNNAQFDIEKRLLYYLHMGTRANENASQLESYIHAISSVLPSKSATLTRSEIFNLITFQPDTCNRVSACLLNRAVELDAETLEKIALLTSETFPGAHVKRTQYLQCVARNLRAAQLNKQKSGGQSALASGHGNGDPNDVDDVGFVYDSAQEEADDQLDDGEEAE